jgi:hypothetical protein
MQTIWEVLRNAQARHVCRRALASRQRLPEHCNQMAKIYTSVQYLQSRGGRCRFSKQRTKCGNPTPALRLISTDTGCSSQRIGRTRFGLRFASASVLSPAPHSMDQFAKIREIVSTERLLCCDSKRQTSMENNRSERHSQNLGIQHLKRFRFLYSPRSRVVSRSTPLMF